MGLRRVRIGLVYSRSIFLLYTEDLKVFYLFTLFFRDYLWTWFGEFIFKVIKDKYLDVVDKLKFIEIDRNVFI